jgi:hydrogenase nickel incorporation protein HypA/HybF
MHEMALAEGVMQIVEETVRRERCTRVKGVWLEVGALAGVEIEALRFCFDVVTRGGPAQEAVLEIVTQPGRGWCMNCAKEVSIGALFDSCPDCGKAQVQPTGGTELRVRELEVE